MDRISLCLLFLSLLQIIAQLNSSLLQVTVLPSTKKPVFFRQFLYKSLPYGTTTKKLHDTYRTRHLSLIGTTEKSTISTTINTTIHITVHTTISTTINTTIHITIHTNISTTINTTIHITVHTNVHARYWRMLYLNHTFSRRSVKSPPPF